MGTFVCLSSAPNLRCETFSRLQSQLLIIPPALEVVFAVSLVVAKWGSGSRKHLLLAAEGWAYFTLALIDLLSHIIPTARKSLTVFETLDIFLASTSFIPLLLYTLFLYLFTSGRLIKSLPQRYRRITKYLIIIFIPAIVALNEVSSFVGISRRVITGPFGSILVIGFQFQRSRGLWVFFSSITLALLTLFQAVNFVLTFYQLIRVFVNQHRIEASQSDEAHLFKGIGWVAAGIKLGAIESVIGFAPAGFGGAFMRRVLRLLGRACLSIGVLKGMDTAEDFRNLHEELRGERRFRRSKIKPLISNPRNSTFRHLSPTETAFHATPRAPNFSPGQGMTQKSPSIATFGMVTPAPWSPAVQSPAMQSPAGYQTVEYRTSKNEVFAYPTPNYTPSFGYLSSNATPTLQTPRFRPQRVTVHHEQGQAPTLEMRFSALDIPSPPALSENADLRYLSGASGFSPTSTYPGVVSSYLQSPPKAMSRSAFPRTRSTADIGSTEQHRYKRSNSYVSRARAMSADSLASDSLEVVRNLAAQFPGLPPRVTGKARGSILGDYYSDDEYPVNGMSREPSTKTYRSEKSSSSMIPTVSHSSSLKKRKPAPVLPWLASSANSVDRAASRNNSTRAEAGHEVSSSFEYGSRRQSSVGTPATENHDPFMYDEAFPPSSKSQTIASSECGDTNRESIHSAEWLTTALRGKRTMAVDIEAYRRGVVRAVKTVSQAPSEALSARDSFGDKLVPSDTLPVPWLGNVGDVKARREAWSRTDLAQIKAVGSVSRKRTPTPTNVAFMATSVSVEQTGMI